VRLTLIIITHDRGRPRLALQAHKNAFARHCGHNVLEVNTAFQVDWQAVQNAEPDIVIWHTSFLSLRWGSAWPQEYEMAAQALNSSGAYHLAMPQDEFLQSNSLCRLFDMVKMSLVLSCAKAQDWPRIYRASQNPQVRFRTILTGGLDDNLLKKAKAFSAAYHNRQWDISYRAWSS